MISIIRFHIISIVLFLNIRFDKHKFEIIMRGIFWYNLNYIMDSDNSQNARQPRPNARKTAAAAYYEDDDGILNLLSESSFESQNQESIQNSKQISMVASDSQNQSFDHQKSIIEIFSSEKNQTPKKLPGSSKQQYFEESDSQIKDMFNKVEIVDIQLIKNKTYFFINGKCSICGKTLVKGQCCLIKQNQILQKDAFQNTQISVSSIGKQRNLLNQKVWNKRTAKNTLKEAINKAGFKFTTKNIFTGNYFSDKELVFQYIGDRKTEEILNQLDDTFDYLPLQIVHIDDEMGNGVFATQGIPADMLLCKYSGELFCQLEYHQKPTNSVVSLGFADDIELLVDPRQYSDLGRFFNHSDEPNIALRKVYTRNGLILVMKTLVQIKKGEQLCWDYGDNYWGGSCKRKRTVADDDNLPSVATKKKMSQANLLDYLKSYDFMFQPALYPSKDSWIDCASIVKLAVSVFVEYIANKTYVKFGNLLDMPIIPLNFHHMAHGNTNVGIGERCVIKISELLKGMLIGSGCDCALTIARYFGNQLTSQYGPESESSFGHICVFLHFLNQFLKENGIEMHVNDPRGVGLNNKATLKGMITLLKLIVSQKGMTYNILLEKQCEIECESERKDSRIQHLSHHFNQTFNCSKFFGKTGSFSTAFSFVGFCFDAEDKYVFLALSAPFNNRDMVLQKFSGQIAQRQCGIIPDLKIKQIQFARQTNESVAEMKNIYPQIRMLMTEEENKQIRNIRQNKAQLKDLELGQKYL